MDPELDAAGVAVGAAGAGAAGAGAPGRDKPPPEAG